MDLRELTYGPSGVRSAQIVGAAQWYRGARVGTEGCTSDGAVEPDGSSRSRHIGERQNTPLLRNATVRGTKP